MSNSHELLVAFDPTMPSDQIRAIYFSWQAAKEKGWNVIESGNPRSAYEELTSSIGALLVIPSAESAKPKGKLFRRHVAEFCMKDLIKLAAQNTDTPIAVIRDILKPIELPETTREIRTIDCTTWRSGAFLGVKDWLDEVEVSQAASQLPNLADYREAAGG